MARFSRFTAPRRWLHNNIVELHRLYLNHVWGMHIGEGCNISMSAKLDRSNPRGVHIGRDTIIAFGATVLTHNFVHRMHVNTYIGERCRIGPHSFIMPGLSIGDDCIIAAGSVVMRDVPSGSTVIGNPGRVMKAGAASSDGSQKLPTAA